MRTTEQLSVRQTLDPECTLPVIHVVQELEVAEWNVRMYDIRYQGDSVGGMEIHQSTQVPESFEHIMVKRGIVKGLGLAAYLWAIEQSHKRGRDFGSGETVSESARKIWDILASTGVARVVDPFDENFAHDGIKEFVFYTGQYIVPHHELHR